MSALVRLLSACWWFVARPLPAVLQLALAVLVLNMPLLIVSGIALEQIDDDIEFCRGELRGASLIRPAIELMQVVQRHRGAMQLAEAGNLSALARIPILRSDISARLDHLNDMAHSGRSEEASSTTSTLGTINESWLAVLQRNPDAGDRGFDDNSQVVTSLILWQQTIAEAYGIVLDPDPASYHLSQALIFQIPHWIEAAAQSRGLGATALERHTIAPDVRSQLLQLEQRQKYRQDEVMHELDRASERRPELRARLQPTLLSAMESGRNFLSLLHQEVLDVPQLSVDADSFYAQGSETVDRIYALAQAGYDSFESIVGSHLQVLRIRRTLVLLMDAAGFLLVALAFGVRRRLREWRSEGTSSVTQAFE
jgi:methyl-accepting chemotaxis protein